ncbi:MAG: hypothetical protein ACE5ER_06710 [Nitrospinaceae bacterium]
MTGLPEPSIFIRGPGALPLLTPRGRAYLGLQRSACPDLAQRVRDLFAALAGLLGFRDTAEGRMQQEAFNELVRYTYPEILIDLADRVYVQHERPMVFLNFDHLRMNLGVDPDPVFTDTQILFARMGSLFYELGETLKQDPSLLANAEIVRPLSEGYSFYLWLTRNFPWEDPLPEEVKNEGRPVLDVATGLAGFSLIHDWPESHPPLILTDSMPFIVEGLDHFRQLSGRRNVEVATMDFPDGGAGLPKVLGRIHASKFLHHLQREERNRFLRWCRERLAPGGHLSIIDTDLEFRILREAEDPEYRDKLMPGYLETLVPIEDKFCHHMVEDVRAADFKVSKFDVREFYDETDAYSHFPGDNLPLKFMGFELQAQKP